MRLASFLAAFINFISFSTPKQTGDRLEDAF